MHAMGNSAAKCNYTSTRISTLYFYKLQRVQQVHDMYNTCNIMYIARIETYYVTYMNNLYYLNMALT